MGDYVKKILNSIENKGCIISRWSNDVDVKKGLIVQSRSSIGFPHYIVLNDLENYYLLICKDNKRKFNELEKKKIEILSKKYFFKIVICVYDKEKDKIRSYSLPDHYNLLFNRYLVKI